MEVKLDWLHFGDHQFKVAMLQKIPWTHVLIYQFILAQSGIQQVASAGSVLKVVNLMVVYVLRL